MNDVSGSRCGAAAPYHLARINDLIEPFFVHISGLDGGR
jgi:hypothetical protein